MLIGMYHCTLKFHMVSCDANLYEALVSIPPLRNFSHEFYRHEALGDCLIACKKIQAYDLFIVNLYNINPNILVDFVKSIGKSKSCKPNLILIGDELDIDSASEVLYSKANIYSIWPADLSMNVTMLRFRSVLDRIEKEVDLWFMKQWFNTLTDSIPNLVWVKKITGEHVYVNEALADTVRKPRKKILGKKHTYVWDVTEDNCGDSESRVISEKKTLRFNESIIVDNESRDLITYKSPLFDCDGSVIGTIGMALDITTEHNYEKAVIEKNRILQKIMDTLDCGVILYTKEDNRVIDINSRALELFGYNSMSDLISDGFNGISPTVHPDDKVKLIAAINSLTKVGDSINNDYQIVKPDGSVLSIIGTTTLIQIASGELCYQRVLVDYTEKGRKERELVDKHTRLISTLSTDYDILITYNPLTDDGDVVLDRHGILKTEYGGNNEHIRDLLLQYVNDCVEKEDSELLLTHLNEHFANLEEGQSYFHDYKETVNSIFRYMRCRASVVAGTIVLGCYDVTEEIKKSTERHRVLEDMLEQSKIAGKVKSNFLSNMSHDLRTPLNAISSFTLLALQNTGNRLKVEEYLRKVDESNKTLLNMINNILDISNIDSQISLDEDYVLIKDLLEETIHQILTSANNKGITVEINTARVESSVIYCDKNRLMQALVNVIDNSIKYNNRGGNVTITVIENVISTNSSDFSFSITDTGIGMAEQQIADVLEPFSRIENTTESGVVGVGVGLTITKHLIENMGGTVSIDSKLDIGTTVTLNLSFKTRNLETSICSESLPKGVVLVLTNNFHTYDSVSTAFDKISTPVALVESVAMATAYIRQLKRRDKLCSMLFIDIQLVGNLLSEVCDTITEDFPDCMFIAVLPIVDKDKENRAYCKRINKAIKYPLIQNDVLSCVSTDTQESVGNSIAGMRVLVVEDNELNQVLMRELLESNDMIVDIANNGKEAVDIMNSADVPDYKIIFMDLQMPIMNGYDATRNIRIKHPTIPIVAVSANSFDTDKEKAYKCGISDFIPKPVDLGVLLDTIHSFSKNAGK